MNQTTATKLEAASRIRNAMGHIELAQRHIGEAASNICSIEGPGMATEWTRLCKLYDRVKAHWYRVQNKLICNRFDLDSDAARNFLSKTPDAIRAN